MKTTKTRTAVSVALTVLAAGGFLAGFYYYSNRNISSQAISSCNVDYDRIARIVTENNEKIKSIIEDKLSSSCYSNKCENASATIEDKTKENKNVDLVITGMHAPSSLIKGGSANVEVIIKNKGLESSGPFVVSLYYGTAIKSVAYNGEFLGEWKVDNLEPGQTLSHNFYCSGKFSSVVSHFRYYFVSEIDSQNSVKETDETNNIYYRTFTVG